MSPFLAELIGTTILVLLGNGVVANVSLKKTFGNDSGLIVIATGWALAVFTAVACVGHISGAHLNPAVTIGLAAAGKFATDQVLSYIAAQMLGGFLGAVLVWAFYNDHYKATADEPNAMLGTFCNTPAISNPPRNLFCEAVGTFILVYAVLMMTPPKFTTTAGAINVAMIVFVIGLCLGGTTGYAINPARDLSPRIAHAILPIAGKRDSNWGYAWIPVIGPILGGLAAAGLYLLAGE
ncbi:UNVERIFIED_CONTAM: hypothetical protein GTU68_066114 [Idotea baltica]|nr:hypothetical protein [Idotea baltica]